MSSTIKDNDTGLAERATQNKESLPVSPSPTSNDSGLAEQATQNKENLSVSPSPTSNDPENNNSVAEITHIAIDIKDNESGTNEVTKTEAVKPSEPDSENVPAPPVVGVEKPANDHINEMEVKLAELQETSVKLEREVSRHKQEKKVMKAEHTNILKNTSKAFHSKWDLRETELEKELIGARDQIKELSLEVDIQIEARQKNAKVFESFTRQQSDSKKYDAEINRKENMIKELSKKKFELSELPKSSRKREQLKPGKWEVSRPKLEKFPISYWVEIKCASYCFQGNGEVKKKVDLDAHTVLWHARTNLESDAWVQLSNQLDKEISLVKREIDLIGTARKVVKDKYWCTYFMKLPRTYEWTPHLLGWFKTPMESGKYLDCDLYAKSGQNPKGHTDRTKAFGYLERKWREKGNVIHDYSSSLMDQIDYVYLSRP